MLDSPIAEFVNAGMNRRTVLLVDQDEAVMTALRELLTAAGYTVVPCRCFEEARRYLQIECPNAIVSQLRLGAFNGLHLVSLARRTAPTIAAVVYSGRADSGIGRDASSEGATYLDRETLIANLIPHLGGAARDQASRDATQFAR